MIRPLALPCFAALALLLPVEAVDRQAAELATCKGERPCKVCSNCSQCKYCKKDGGYCGVCSKSVPE